MSMGMPIDMPIDMSIAHPIDVSIDVVSSRRSGVQPSPCLRVHIAIDTTVFEPPVRVCACCAHARTACTTTIAWHTLRYVNRPAQRHAVTRTLACTATCTPSRCASSMIPAQAERAAAAAKRGPPSTDAMQRGPHAHSVPHVAAWLQRLRLCRRRRMAAQRLLTSARHVPRSCRPAPSPSHRYVKTITEIAPEYKARGQGLKLCRSHTCSGCSASSAALSSAGPRVIAP